MLNDKVNYNWLYCSIFQATINHYSFVSQTYRIDPLEVPASQDFLKKHHQKERKVKIERYSLGRIVYLFLPIWP